MSLSGRKITFLGIAVGNLNNCSCFRALARYLSGAFEGNNAQLCRGLVFDKEIARTGQKGGPRQQGLPLGGRRFQGSQKQRPKQRRVGG